MASPKLHPAESSRRSSSEHSQGMAAACHDDCVGTSTMVDAGHGADTAVQGTPNRDEHGRGWLAQRLEGEVTLKHADIIFLFCYFLSGLCDSSVFRAWGCFVSMQTGNTVFLGLGASDYAFRKTSKWLKSPGFNLLCALLIIAASLLQSGAISGKTGPQSSSGGSGSGIVTADDPQPDKAMFLELVPIALVAFQSSGQMAASRLLGFNEIPTTVLTSLYYDLASDPGLLLPLSQNVKRNRRLNAAIGVIAGAIFGGWLARATGGIETALWIAAASKFVIANSWLFWKGEQKIPSPV
ncbi:domain containing protein [Coccidioides immitis RMSCC 2394]|uniref:Domain containing protein n=1 Tax=Coccidioides immitis RMSCC 2394 TaxID=404692 RepID=A0A0J6Y4I5_COCIT|nr:domain containing protein [Coccidioides immitis RMSCC 2394]